MRKSIFTFVLLVSLQMAAFAQNTAEANTNASFKVVEKIVDEKSDITGTFANAGGWNIYVDDATLKIDGKPVKEFANADMQSLLRTGYKFVQKNKAKSACYKYKITAEQDGSQKMYLYSCGL